MAWPAWARGPVVQGTDLRFEAYLFDFSGDLYDKHLRVQLVEWIRPELNFSGLEELTRAIEEDCRTARAILARRA